MSSKKDSDGANTSGGGSTGRGHWDGCPYGFWALSIASGILAAVHLFAPYEAAHLFKRPAATAAEFSKAAVTTLDVVLLRVIGTGFISAAAAYLVEGRNAAQATPGMPTASRLNAGLLGWNLFSLAMLPVHKDALSKLGLGALACTYILGIIVTGTHQARRTGSAYSGRLAASVIASLQAAAKALIAFPILGPGEVSGLGQKESETGLPPSHANLRAKLLLGASWSLALTGWSYILLPRFTLSAYFGASGDQADVLMWRLIGFVHLLLANITQNLEDAVVRGRLGTLTHKILDAGVTGTGLGHLFILGPMLRAGDGGWALPMAIGTWAFVFVSAACQLIAG